MAKSKTFIRENRVRCGDSGLELLEIFQYTDEGQNAAARKRKPREKITPEKIRRMNDKRAKRYFYALLNTNFGRSDLHLTLTYSDENLPQNEKEAARKAKRFLERLKRRRAKLDLPDLKYVLVTEYSADKHTGELKRIHHHLVINGGMERDDVELMWTEERINWARLAREKAQGRRDYREELEGKRLGFANADRLKLAEDGLAALAKYLMKSPVGRQRWTCSRNLEKPTRAKNDHKYSRRKVQTICTNGDVFDRAWWEKSYPGYTLAGSSSTAVEVTEPDDMNNWSIFVKLRQVGGETGCSGNVNLLRMP